MECIECQSQTKKKVKLVHKFPEVETVWYCDNCDVYYHETSDGDIYSIVD